MDTTGYLPLSTARALQRGLDVTSNNLANANTAGFRADRMVFESMIDRSASPFEPVAYSFDRLTYSDLAQGGLQTTGNPLDIAVQGDGWFGFETPDGRVALGRSGQFVVDAEGMLRMAAGHPVLDAGGGPIQLPLESGTPEIARDGTISLEDGQIIGQIGVFDAPDIATWERLADGMFVPREGAPTPLEAAAAPVVVQGAIEQSNVNPISEMVRMIQIQRSYDQAMAMASNHNDLRQNTLSRLGQKV